LLLALFLLLLLHLLLFLRVFLLLLLCLLSMFLLHSLFLGLIGVLSRSLGVFLFLLVLQSLAFLFLLSA